MKIIILGIIIFFQATAFGQEDTKVRKKSTPKKSSPRPVQKPRVVIAQDTESTLANEGQKLFDQGFDQQAKESSIIALVDKAIAYLENHTVQEACSAFMRDDAFISGEASLFMFDMHNTELVAHDIPALLWKDVYKLKDDFGRYFAQEMTEKAQAGGGWVVYAWQGAIKSSYVKVVQKEEQSYVVGAGYYPHSKSDTVVNMVKAAVALFNKNMQKKQPPEALFSLINYPLNNQFVIGDLYLYAVAFDEGVIVAQGSRPGLVGSKSLEHRDPQGKQENREIIEKLKITKSGGVWVEYISRNAPKKAYAEKVVDAQGKEYFIACGYYPDADRQKVVELVRRGYQYMEAHGRTAASQEFSTKRSDTFRYGDLSLVVYTLTGECVADGRNEEAIGKNFWDEKDDEGHYYIREMIEKAKDGGGWLNFRMKNAFLSVYVEQVDLSIEKFVIASGVYPISKPETMMLMHNSAMSYLRDHSVAESLREFVNPDSDFTRGDLSIFVFDTNGVCLSWGTDHAYIWQNLLGNKDDEGRPYVKLFINTAKFGAGKVSYTLHGRRVVAAVDKLEKEGKTYIVGSQYFM
ncbi:MAG TPA: cache domain-containing protein [Candidatus Bathyarchaeia archaeon]|nr:cache domain-containing protein [Candidatus Bathyarchaeia archaeon]